jgi:predicted MFS family arabinose efflux permease
VTNGRRSLAAYLVTATLARSATESAGPALLLSTIALVGSAATGSYLVACLTASAALCGPVVGALLDRSPRPRTAFALALGALAAGLAGLALAIGRVPTAVLIALALLAGLGYPAITGAWSAQIPRLVLPDARSGAYAKDAATYSIAAVVAPPAAAALVALSARAPLWLPVLLVGIALLSLRLVPLQPGSHIGRRSLAQDLRAGFAVMLGNRALRRTVVLTTVGFAGTAAIFVAAPLISQRLTGGLEFTGVLLGVFAAGGVITALAITRRPVRRPDRAIIAGTAASALFLAAVGLGGQVWAVLLAAFLMGASEPPIVSSMFQVRARESPDEIQAQVFTTSASLRMTAFAAATAVCGALVALGIGAIVAFGVLLHLVALVLGIAFGPAVPHRGEWLRRRA